MSLPVRSTLVRLNSAKILLSPGSALSTEQYDSLDSVTDIVAPNLLHCAGVPRAAQAFPKAHLWGVKGVKKQKSDIHWTHILGEDVWPYSEELSLVTINGISRINETVFIHKESASLIICDLCFNMTNTKGFGAWLILNLFGTYRQFAVSRFFARFINDKTAFQKSMEQLFSYDFDNIIVNHGENIIGNAKSHLLKGLKARGLGIRP
ncbi:MAG: hypothetical protein AABY64_05505 [Bdellovibrionota bacterium]